MRPGPLNELLTEAAAACRDADVTDWTADDLELIGRGLSTVSYEVVGLAARIRAAKVNNTPVPHPVRPAPQPKPQPTPQPKPTPPPPPAKNQGPG